jgi:hypothetical protein
MGGTSIRQPLIPAPSRDPISRDFTPESIIPSPIDPVRRTNMKRNVDNGPVMQRYIPIADGLFNTMPSLFDIVQSLWWPGETTWERVHAPLFRSDVEQEYARMPRGHLTPGIYDRENIRQPRPLSQGSLQVLAEGGEE